MSLNKQEDHFLFKNIIPLTTFKAIHVIVIVGLIVFFNILFNGFVWDDKGYIINYPIIHSFDIGKLLGTNLWNTGLTYKPLQPFYFASLYAVFKDHAFFYHFVQIILHIICSSLLFVFLKRYIHSIAALFLSLLFLVHPIQVEAVAYIAASGTELFFLFGMIALLLSTKENLGLKHFILISILLLLSLFAREEGLLFLLMVMIYGVMFSKKQRTKFLLMGFMTFMSYLIIRGLTIGFATNLVLVNTPDLSLVNKLLNLPAVIFYYLKTLFYPAQLAIDQWWVIPQVDFFSFYLPFFLDLLFFALLSFLGVYLYQKKKLQYKIFVFFFLWFLIGLFMHSQLVPVGNTVADRYFYFPFAGFLGMIGVFLSDVKLSSKKLGALLIIIVIIIILLSIRTVIRNANWRDEITLYKHDVQILSNYDLENNLGTVYVQTGNYQEALKHYKRSI